MASKALTLILQNVVLFPNQEIKLELNNKQSKKIISTAILEYKSEIILVNPKDNANINIKDLPEIGVIGNIKGSLVLPNGNMRITIRGNKRIKIKEVHYIPDNDELLESIYEHTNPVPYNLDKENAYIRKIKSLFNKYIEVNSDATNEYFDIIKNTTNLSKLCDIIGASLNLDYDKKCTLIMEEDYYKRAHKLINILNSEIASSEYENKLENEIRNNFEKSEKDIVIREKINLLNKELGVTNDKYREVEDFRKRINSLNVKKEVKESLKREVRRFEYAPEASPELSVIRGHLEFVLSLPWNKSTIDKSDIKEIDKALNSTHYGLNDAKTRIIEYLLLKQKCKNLHSPVLCLIGPPGTGKTTFARELASSLGRKFIKISVGGLNDSSELIGHRKTYIGSGPGKIMEGIRRVGANNPIILIDEVDKMVKDYKGDPASVLLDILDVNQNKEFVDNYVSESFDLSGVIFILTANDETEIPTPLKDRLEIVLVNSYTLFDKIEIAKNYTLPRLGREYNFDYKKILLSDDVITKIITDYTNESGVRELERQISSIVRKILIKGLNGAVKITSEDLIYYLGTNKYRGYINTYDTYGTVNVPVKTSTGGSILNIECTIYRGDEEIITTGLLGKVAKESAIVSLSYIKSNLSIFNIDKNDLKGKTIHIHALDGASKKEGPSAGLGITASILSQILEKKVPENIAFTGEISLSGRILRVGSIKEKLICAYNRDIKIVYIPKENMQDLNDIPKKILKKITVKPVSSFTEVYTDIFE